jgi:DNA topoisomerase-1
MNPRQLTLEQALQLLSLPRELGTAADGGVVVARSGRFGPYLEKTIPGDEKPKTRSLPSEDRLLTVTLAEAEALFAVPKRGRGRGAAREPLRELGADPVSGAPVVVRDGRYGVYVTDGTTNATLPKGTSVEELTLGEAARLLAERREAGPPKKRAKGRTRRST